MTPNPLVALSIALLLFAFAAILLWPQKGLLVKWQQARRLTKRVLREDALKHIHRAQRSGMKATVQSVAGDLQISVDEAAKLLAEMEQLGLLITTTDNFKLTPEGEAAALHIIRAHRLWETYLAEHTGYSKPEWHEKAEELEHTLPPQEIDSLAQRLGNPVYDPHGDPIPTSTGEFQPHGGVPLPDLPEGAVGRIVHLEDEPELVYAQLTAEGLHPGQEIHLLEKLPTRIRFWADGNEHVLAPLLARNITVREEQVPSAELPPAGERLSALDVGQTAEVIALSRAIRASERHRLMDLGILPGTRIQAAFRSPGNDPTAYLVRDTLIALRREQASMITVRPLQEANS
ncbi:MAG: DtxR family transcriptional regulator [Chloroflexi bacterium]|nr:DtxR family transcriptional regulator [Chloroflexota bacterium]